MDLRESMVTEMIQRDERSKWLSYNNHNIKCFTEGEIGRITSNYADIIGKGGFGEVYRGFLEDGSTVAVKRFVRNVEESFAKELKVHSEINHKNVVRLIGYCAEENALMIVTEYISKGNLRDVLHHNFIPIMLDTRLRIAVECSEALCYMHSQMYTQVIHGDIKPANILLDDNLNAKISDFGISRLVNTDAAVFTEHVIGSIGYMDPLFARYGRLTSKSDVYSFGIVLLELITKKKATVKKGEIGIVECFTQTLTTGVRRVRELFDVEISSQNNMRVLEGVAKLAGECLRMEMDRRPEMIDVAERLRALRKTQVQGKQTLTTFPWGWRNKPASQNNWQSSSASGVHVSQSMSSNLCRHFSLKEIKSATGNFDESNLVGVGVHGEVYYGVIDGGATKVAIRCCRGVQDVSKFQAEITTMAKLRHHHLASLVGYCIEKNEVIMIYNYIAGGTLRGRLYGYNTKEPPLTWKQRLDVCIGVARALHYLHLCSIIYKDLSTTKILLDERSVAKVSHAVSLLRDYTDEGTYLMWGCTDPEFVHTLDLTEKSDVYCFGIVMFEVLCARPAWDPTLPENQVDLVECALNCKKRGIIDLIVDPYLEGKIAPRCFNKFVETAEKCVADHGADRPSIREVLQNLETCLAEETRGLDDEVSDDDDTNRPSLGGRRQNLEMYLSGVHVPQSLPSNYLCRQFSPTEIESATSNFDESHLVGEGRSCEVYYGFLDIKRGRATKVAIKRGQDVQDVRFQEEIAMLANLCHHHLVSLVGYCKKDNKTVLIYDYMAGGTLHGRLHGHNSEEPPLTWRQRLDVCIGAARALHYLHECSIIHCDLTTKNILLDERLVAKVSRAFSPRTEGNSVSSGTLGYLAPEVSGGHYYKLTEESDVYSFGVVLFEVLCARAAWDPTLPIKQVVLVECALNYKKKGILDLIVDPYLEGKIDPRCLNKFVETAEKCVAFKSVDRPSMGEVLQNLETCLAEESRGLGDEVSDDDGTNRPSVGGRPQNLEMYLSDESGSDDDSALVVHVPQFLPSTAEKCVAFKSVDRPSMGEVLQNLEMCLAEESRGLGDEVSDDDGTNRPSVGGRRQNLEMYLSDESGSDDGSALVVHVPQFLPSNLCRHFSLEEMKSTTRNFHKSHLAGVGRSSIDYYGLIDGGATKVAIKRGRVGQDVEKFQTEIATRAKLHHKNLLSLVGYCTENDERILIYDYMAHGTLRGRLYGCNTKEPPLTWKQRLDLCVGAARALHYLHECSIIHCDLSTTNILLDERLSAKVSLPFVLSAQHNSMSKDTRGTDGYLDPEFFMTMQLTKESDVYSFGVVLFEVLCARPVLDPTLPSEKFNLVECALNGMEEMDIRGLTVDPHLEIDIWYVRKLADVAKKCVANRRVDRPLMKEVLQKLEKCLAEVSGWPMIAR